MKITYAGHTVLLDSRDGQKKAPHSFKTSAALAAGACLGRSCMWQSTVTGQPSPTLSASSPRTMAHLYCDPEWSQNDLHGPISHVRERLTKSKIRALSPEHLASYRQELQLRASQGLPTTAVDLWALFLEFILHGQVLRLRQKPPRRVGGAEPWRPWEPLFCLPWDSAFLRSTPLCLIAINRNF